MAVTCIVYRLGTPLGAPQRVIVKSYLETLPTWLGPFYVEAPHPQPPTTPPSPTPGPLARSTQAPQPPLVRLPTPVAALIPPPLVRPRQLSCLLRPSPDRTRAGLLCQASQPRSTESQSPTKPRPSQLISPQAKLSRLAAIEEGLRPSFSQSEHLARVKSEEGAAQLTSALLAKERIRAKIQVELDLVEDEIAESLDAAGPAFLTLQQTFTPPNTPSHSHKTDAEAVVFATPSKPAAYVDHSYTQVLNDRSRFRSCSPTPAPRIVPGGRFVLPSTPKSVASLISYTALDTPDLNTSAWYILYHGCDGAQGLFDSYDERRSGKQSLRDLTQFYNHCIFKKFNDYPTAKMYYEEHVESKVLNMLQPAPEKDEVFIVIRGVRPGIYVKRITLLVGGLAWWGGEVMVAVGSKSDVLKVFAQWDSGVDKKTEMLPEKGLRV
ncbi:hypothetical protein F5051DRAFT_446188 [Lentinula edodes]|nr:hypothetical protein F5051DRAFT_446188 [Lentinula edodes]